MLSEWEKQDKIVRNAGAYCSHIFCKHPARFIESLFFLYLILTSLLLRGQSKRENAADIQFRLEPARGRLAHTIDNQHIER